MLALAALRPIAIHRLVSHIEIQPAGPSALKVRPSAATFLAFILAYAGLGAAAGSRAQSG
jgi:hypothetical protein